MPENRNRLRPKQTRFFVNDKGRGRAKAVYVEAPGKSSGKCKQKVHMEYDLVGFIPVDELIKAE